MLYILQNNYIQISAPGYQPEKKEFTVKESEFLPPSATELHIILYPLNNRTAKAATDGGTGSILPNTTETPANIIKSKHELKPTDTDFDILTNEIAFAVTSNNSNCNLVSPIRAFLLYLIVFLIFSLSEF